MNVDLWYNCGELFIPTICMRKKEWSALFTIIETLLTIIVE